MAAGNYDEEVLLLDIIQHYPFLYDKSLPDYKNNNKKENAWQSIAEALQITVEEVQRMWRLLREKYGKERRINTKTPSGSAAAESTWPLYSAMHFMEKHIATRRRVTNVSRPSSASEIIPLSSPSCSSESSVWSTYNTLVDDKAETETQHSIEETQHSIEESQHCIEETQHGIEETPPTPKKMKTRVESGGGTNNQVSKSLTVLTDYLQQKQKPNRNIAFGQYVGLSLTEMPVSEQNYKILKIVEILKETFD